MTRALTSVGAPLHSPNGPARRSITDLRRRVTHHSPLATAFLIANGILERPLTHSKQTTAMPSNREKFRDHSIAALRQLSLCLSASVANPRQLPLDDRRDANFGYTTRMPERLQPAFRRVAVIGTGLIGGSFALALDRYFPAIARVGFDRKDVLARAKARGAIQESASDLASAVRGADLVYIALPVGAAIESLPAIAGSVRPDALVTDACSTKTVICRSAHEHFRSGARFLGGHPIAGKETSGIEHADEKLFRGSRYALIAQEEDSDPRVQQFAALLRTLGAEPDWCDAETHDWAVGIVSHLPQLLSVALARVVQDESDETGLPMTLAGPGLEDMLRLAGSPYSVWRDICLTNSENISRALDRLMQAVDYLRTHLSSKDLEEEFRAANELYKLLHKSK
jgi:prephenate dehydrogenase